MAREKTIMELQDILKRLKAGHTIKQINRETGTHRGVIRKLKNIALQNDWIKKDEPLPTEKQLHDTYYGETKTTSHVLDTFHDELVEYHKSDVSYIVMHQLLKGRTTVSESTLRRYVQTRIEPGIPRAIVQRQREMSVMEVDFGRLGVVYDPREKRNRVAYVFSARLRYSALAYRDIVYDQKQETFWECNIRAFEHFGGVPVRVVPDNLKAAVVKASFTDPVVNRGFHDLAMHYGFLIDPCLPYHPRHKGGVENDIKYVKRNFYAAFRMRERHKGREIPFADDIIPALREWERDIANVRILREMGATPLELFESEFPSLLPLPADRFDPFVWAKATVRESGRIHFDLSRYSVPERYIGKEVLVAANTRKIRVFFDHELIAEHQRATKPHENIDNPNHLGARARAYLDYTRENLLKRARVIGEAVYELAGLVLSDPAVARERYVHGLITLAGKYGSSRVDAACRRALDFDAPRYDVVKRILENNLDATARTSPVDSHGQCLFTFARKPGYFAASSHTMEEQA